MYLLSMTCLKYINYAVIPLKQVKNDAQCLMVVIALIINIALNMHRTLHNILTCIQTHQSIIADSHPLSYATFFVALPMVLIVESIRENNGIGAGTAFGVTCVLVMLVSVGAVS